MKNVPLKQHDPSDVAVIEKVLLGDTELFGVLFDRYSKRVFGYLWHFTNRREDCEDFLQDTFHKAYVNLKYCREWNKFPSWLFSIARNVAISGSKRLSLRYTRELNEERAMPALENAVSTDDISVELIRHEGAEYIQKVISGMPIKYREVLVLFYYNEFSLKEICEMLGEVPMNTVKTRLHRARHHLGEKLREAQKEKKLHIPAVTTS